MFNFYKYNINVVYRIIFLILFAITIMFIKNPYVLVFLTLGITYINKKPNLVFCIFSSFTFFFLVWYLLSNDVLLINYLLVIEYLLVFFPKISKDDLIFLKKLFNKQKYLYSDLNTKYRSSLVASNEKIFDDFVKNMEFDESIYEIKSRLKDKNNYMLYEKSMINYVRFYKNRNDVLHNYAMNIETVAFLVVHIILLIVAIVWWYNALFDYLFIWWN